MKQAKCPQCNNIIEIAYIDEIVESWGLDLSAAEIRCEHCNTWVNLDTLQNFAQSDIPYYANAADQCPPERQTIKDNINNEWKW